MRSIAKLALIAVVGAALGLGRAWAESSTSAATELDAHVTTAQRAIASGDADAAVRAFDAIAAFYRRGGDMVSVAAAELEAARILFAHERYDDALALLERSEVHEIASARLAQRQHMRAFMLERKGDAAGAQRSLAAVNRRVTREDWNRHLADDAKRLGVGYGWPVLERRWLAPILVLEWGALIALVLFFYRRAVRRDVGAVKAGE